MEEPSKEDLRLRELEIEKRELELKNKELQLQLNSSNLHHKNPYPIKFMLPLIAVIIVAGVLVSVLFLHSSPSTLNVPVASNISASSSGVITFSPLSGTLLSQINNYPAKDLISVAEGLLNGSLNIPIDSSTVAGIFSLKLSGVQVPAIESNGKIDFYFAGQSACQFCGRDRWAINLALSQFGKFGSLYTGYTYGDANYPTLFWSNNITNLSSIPSHYSDYQSDNSYSSNSINFTNVDLYPYDGSGFYGPSVSYMEAAAPTMSTLFSYASKYDNSTVSSGGFGTPLELFGNYLVNGAFTDVPVPYESFSNIISSFYSLNSQFALATVAGSDMYIADFCHINQTAGPICSEYNWTAFYNKFG